MKKVLQIILLFIIPFLAQAQAPNFEVRIENEQLVSSTEYQFDINLYATGTTTSWELSGFSVGIAFDSAWRNGATFSTAASTILMSGTSDMNALPNQIPVSASILTTSKPYRIQIASTSSPGAGSGTIITQAGKRLTRVKLLATAGTFSLTSPPNLYFLFTSYPTSLSAYIGSTNTVIAGNSTVSTNGVTPANGTPFCKSSKYWNGSSWSSYSWQTPSTYSLNTTSPTITDNAVIYSGTYSQSLTCQGLYIAANAIDSLPSNGWNNISNTFANDGNFNAKNGILHLSGANQNISGSGISVIRSLYFTGSGNKTWNSAGIVSDTLKGNNSILNVLSNSLRTICNINSNLVNASFTGILSVPAYITTNPIAQTKPVGSSCSFTVNALGNNLSYQWKKNGNNISGATSSTYSFATLAYADSGNYSVDVSNSCGTISSSNAYLSVINGATITLQPSSQSVCQNSKTVLRVAAIAASGSLSFQWKKNNVNIVGATDSVYTINSTNLSDSGTYTVLVSDQSSSILSSQAILSTLAITSITTQPVYQIKTIGSSASFSVTATGAGTLTYQWYKSITTLSAATSNVLNLSTISFSDSGAYTVNVIGTCGSVTSSIARLYVYNNVTFTKQPQSTGACNTASIVISAKASAGLGNIKYQWKKNGVNLTGKTDTLINIASFSIADTGVYVLYASDSLSNASSNSASITLKANTQITQQPLSVGVNVGMQATFSVAANGSNLTYQWYKNSTLINGAISNALSFNSTTSNDAGSYYVLVSGDCGNVISNNAVLTINYLNITSQPIGNNICSNSSYTLTVNAQGNGNITYQWLKNNIPINGAVSSTYSINNATFNDSGVYACNVTNAFGTIKTNDAIITVKQGTQINIQPQAQIKVEGQSVSFISSASGPSSVTYQWRKNSVAITGAIDSVLSLSNLSPADSGLYSVVASSSCGAILSNAVKLTVNYIRIGSQPLNTSVCLGATSSFGVSASGNTELKYQWFLNGVAINGATNPYYTVLSASYSDTGKYYVNVSNAAGTLNSTNSIFKLKTNTQIISQPQNLTTNVGTSAVFFVNVNASGNKMYQWYKNSIIIPQANDSFFMINNASIADSGLYSVKVTADCGSDQSTNAKLNINYLNIITQPSPVSECAGANASLSVLANGNGVLSYSWFKDGIAINGATSANLDLKNINKTNAGLYLVKISNAFGLISSNAVNVSIKEATKVLVQPKLVQVRDAASIFMAQISAKGEGTLRFQWYQNGNVISGANDSILKINSISKSDSGIYYATVSASCGIAKSDSGLLIVSDANEIYLLKQPESNIICPGQKIVMRVFAISNGPLSYQWKRSGLLLVNGLDSVLTLTNVKATDAGNYTCDIISDKGVTVSNAATLTVKAGSVINVQPQGATKLTKTNYSFSVIATGTGSVSYQWFKDGATINGATNASLDLINLSLADSGAYFVKVSSECNSVNSDTVFLHVNKPGGIPSTISAIQAIVYPVPSNGIIHLSASDLKAGNYDVVIYDVQGKVMYHNNENLTPANGMQWNLNLTDGLYYLELNSTQSYLTLKSKFIIQH